jgi:hypothetical protein
LHVEEFSCLIEFCFDGGLASARQCRVQPAFGCQPSGSSPDRERKQKAHNTSFPNLHHTPQHTAPNPAYTANHQHKMICGRSGTTASRTHRQASKPTHRHGLVRVRSVRCVAAAAAAKVETVQLGKSGETVCLNPTGSCPAASFCPLCAAHQDVYQSTVHVLVQRSSLMSGSRLCAQECTCPMHAATLCVLLLPPSPLASLAGLQVPVMGIGAWSWGDRSGYWGYGKGYGE